MSAKTIVYHAVKEVHVTKRRKKVKVGAVKPQYSGYWWNEPSDSADVTLCGYRVGKNRGYWSNRVTEVHAAKRCPRTVTCKQCKKRVEFRKANPNVK